MIARAIKPRMSTIERIECLVGQLEIEAKKLLDEEQSLRQREGAVSILIDIERLKQRIRLSPQRMP